MLWPALHLPPHHSFPTRRSSDLGAVARLHVVAEQDAEGLALQVVLRLELAAELAERRVDLGEGLGAIRSEEHTSELQSLRHLVCRLLLEKKNDCEPVGIAGPVPV